MNSNNTPQFEWAEPLPSNCPEEGAYAPNREFFFRLVDSIPPTNKDFDSIKKRAPSRQIPNISECIQRACSIWTSSLDCDQLRKAFPTLRKKIIIEIELSEESGLIKQTGRPNHFSWWRAKNFDPLLYYSEVE